MPNVAIHIVTFNNASTILRCLQSIQVQTYRNFSLCIIDNASTDNTRELIAARGIRLYRSNRNLGYAHGHNLALHKTKSDFVLTLNPDVVLEKSFLLEMVNTFKTCNSEYGSAAGQLIRVQSLHQREGLIDGMGLFIRKNRRQGLNYESKSPGDCPSEPFDIFGPDGAAAFYRRKMLIDIQVNKQIFDEDFFLHKEDVDICWRSQLRGWKSLCIPTAKAYHIRSFRAGQRQNVSPEVRMLAVRNRYYLLIKNDTIRAILKDGIPILLYEIKIFLYILFREQYSFLAYIAVIHALPALLKKRTSIQQHRRITPERVSHLFI